MATRWRWGFNPDADTFTRRGCSVRIAPNAVWSKRKHCVAVISGRRARANEKSATRSIASARPGLASGSNASTAQSFVDYVLSDPGQATLAKYGFLPAK